MLPESVGWLQSQGSMGKECLCADAPVHQKHSLASGSASRALMELLFHSAVHGGGTGTALNKTVK